jgi:hypothetical protein
VNTSNRLAMLAAISAGLIGGFEISSGSLLARNGVKRVWHPWDDEQLSKSQRSGKTPGECQWMRKVQWETRNNTSDPPKERSK